ncbi:MAG: hypothetical protein J6N15_09430, partial [Ruminiclostridium sp.]|nr:hypothetical protein [Ruminiclostridium sp.]
MKCNRNIPFGYMMRGGKYIDDIRSTAYWTDAMAGSFDAPEKTDVSIQLKWLPQAQFMGYFVAKAK